MTTSTGPSRASGGSSGCTPLEVGLRRLALATTPREKFIRELAITLLQQAEAAAASPVSSGDSAKRGLGVRGRVTERQP